VVATSYAVSRGIALSVTLTPDEMHDASEVAFVRMKNKLAWNDKIKNCKLSPTERGIGGVIGELAVAKLLQTDIDRMVYRLGDDGADLKVENYTVAVRYTRHRSGRLIQDEKGLRADFAVLALEGDAPKIELMGYSFSQEVIVAGVISRPTFDALKTDHPINNDPAQFVTQKDLSPFWFLYLATTKYKDVLKNIKTFN